MTSVFDVIYISDCWGVCVRVIRLRTVVWRCWIVQLPETIGF